MPLKDFERVFLWIHTLLVRPDNIISRYFNNKKSLKTFLPAMIFLFQSSCGGLDPPQTFESQEPLERSKPDKELNDTYTRPLEPQQKEKLPIIPMIPEKNNSEILRSDNDSFKINEGTEDIGYSNLLDGDKSNGTDNGSRMKRKVRDKRETDEISSEEMGLTDQSKELAGARGKI